MMKAKTLLVLKRLSENDCVLGPDGDIWVRKTQEPLCINPVEFFKEIYDYIIDLHQTLYRKVNHS